jgi:hypothetical protein
MWRHVIWQNIGNVSDDYAASILRVELCGGRDEGELVQYKLYLLLKFKCIYLTKNRCHAEAETRYTIESS